jgi:hypothetical protein
MSQKKVRATIDMVDLLWLWIHQQVWKWIIIDVFSPFVFMSATKDQELLVAKINLVILKIEVWEILLHVRNCLLVKVGCVLSVDVGQLTTSGEF